MPQSWSIFSHYLNGLRRPSLGDPKPPTLWPSEATALVADGDEVKVVGKCRRQVFFRYFLSCHAFSKEYFSPDTDPTAHAEFLKSYSSQSDDYMLFIWAQGELYEKYIIELAKSFGIFCHEQVPIYIKEYAVSGKIDLVVSNPETNKLVITEIKSVYGFNADQVLGKESARRKGELGEPRDSNLMQIALYHWWSAAHDPAFEYSRLLYGSRDTGRFAEYLIKTEEVQIDGKSIIEIWYKPFFPNEGEWVKSPITITSILECYDYISHSVWTNTLPPADFKMKYSREDIDKLYKKGALSKTDSTQYEKVLQREAENITRVEEGKKPLAEIRLPEKGDYQCRYCSFSRICFDKNGDKREIEWTPKTIALLPTSQSTVATNPNGTEDQE